MSREFFFAADFMFCMGRKYNYYWGSWKENNPLTPFTRNMAECIDALLLKKDSKITMTYRRIARSNVVSESQFKSFARRIFVRSSWTLSREEEYFEACIVVSRLAVLYYIDGMQTAPDIAVELMVKMALDVQSLYRTELFSRINEYCLELLR